MGVPSLTRLGCSALLYVGLSVVCVTAQPTPSDPVENNSRQQADFERLAKIFASPGTPNVKGKPWVAADTGPANNPSVLRGWLIGEGTREITLLDWSGDLNRLRKPAPGEKRPRIKQEKDGGFLLTTTREADYSVAWKVQGENLDFVTKARKFLADGLPTDKEADDIYGSVRQRFGLAAYVTEAARFAHYSHVLGHQSQAADLYAHACKAQRKYTASYVGGGQKAAPLHIFVADQIASGLRNGAIFSGHGGTARTEIREQWQKIAAIPYHRSASLTTAVRTSS